MSSFLMPYCGVNVLFLSTRYGKRTIIAAVEKLGDEDKMVVKKLIDAFLTKKQIQSLAAR